MHCIIGEAYATFVRRNFDCLNVEYFKSVYDSGEEGSTAKAIDELVDCAVIQGPILTNRRALAHALTECVAVNDISVDAGTIENYLSRAKRVATTWKELVLPLLQ